MLRELNKYDIPVLISNGMSTVSELYQAVNIIDNLYGIMQCNSSYPSAYNELDLYVMHGLKRENDYNVKVGYSGHEIGYVPTLIAVALGAEIIERHITLDKNAEGSDHKASLDINELNQMMRDIDIVQQSLGNGYKTVYPSEAEVKKKLRQI
jgi:sialic acid synthase SpsE